MIDTGASASVTPPSFSSHVKLEEMDATSSMKLQTATADPIHLYSFKDVYLIIVKIDLCVRFYISDVLHPMLGLNNIMTSGATLNISDPLSSMIIKNGKEELLQYLHRHLWAEAIVLPVDHNVNAAWIFYIQNKHFTDSNGLCLNDIEHPDNITDNLEQTGEARAPVSQKASSLPSLEPIQLHSLTHQSFRSWCPICQRARGRQGHHHRRPAHEQPSSIIQMDCAYVNHPEEHHLRSDSGRHPNHDPDYGWDLLEWLMPS